MRLLVCGDRNWQDYHAIRREIARRMPTLVIEGEARGADTHARKAAISLGISVQRFPADWETFGRAAGPIRNREMLEQGMPDEVIAFHADLASSRGTADMVRIARKAGIPVTVYTE